MRVLVAVNPKASRAEEALPRLPDWFSGRAEATLHTAQSSEALTGVLEEHGPAADRIVIGGGDGTISGALPTLLKLGKPLAVLPLGTANDFANTLALPRDIPAAAETALEGRVHKVDVGLVNGTPFLNVASVGVAASAVEAQSPELKRRWRVLAYPISLLRIARESQPFVVKLTIDGQPEWSAPVYQASVANGRFHGGGLTVADHAAIDDGVLDVYAVRPGPLLELMACVTHLKFGFSEPALLQRACASHVTLVTSKPRPINADGELKAETPAEFRLLRNALDVVVPRQLPPDHAGLSGVD